MDKVARASCFSDQPSALPLPAVSTTNGLSSKSRRDAACSTEELPRTYSSIVLRRWLAVARGAHLAADQAAAPEDAARRPRPVEPVETNAETRPMRS